MACPLRVMTHPPAAGIEVEEGNMLGQWEGDSRRAGQCCWIWRGGTQQGEHGGKGRSGGRWISGCHKVKHKRTRFLILPASLLRDASNTSSNVSESIGVSLQTPQDISLIFGPNKTKTQNQN